MAHIRIDNSSYVVHRPDTIHEVNVGDFITEDLYSDTVVWEVIKTTGKTITARRCTKGDTLHREDRNGNGWPQIYREALTDPDGDVRILRERKRRNGKDGHYSFDTDGRRGTYPARMIDGKPVSVTDYRY